MMHLTLVEHEARHFHDPGTHCTSVRSDSGSWDNRFILIPNASQGPVAEPVEVSASLRAQGEPALISELDRLEQ